MEGIQWGSVLDKSFTLFFAVASVIAIFKYGPKLIDGLTNFTKVQEGLKNTLEQLEKSLGSSLKLNEKQFDIIKSQSDMSLELLRELKNLYENHHANAEEIKELVNHLKGSNLDIDRKIEILIERLKQ